MICVYSNMDRKHKLLLIFVEYNYNKKSFVYRFDDDRSEFYYEHHPFIETEEIMRKDTAERFYK